MKKQIKIKIFNIKRLSMKIQIQILITNKKA